MTQSLAIPEDGTEADELAAIPGHLIRRCQQIAVAIFLDEFKDVDLKPVQYAALAAVHLHPGVDQRRLVDLIAVDRSTIGAILKSLESRGLIRRETPKDNLRIKRLYVLAEGDNLLRRSRALIERVQARILAPLDTSEQAQFLQLLSRMVEGNNEQSRVPLKLRRPGKHNVSD